MVQSEPLQDISISRPTARVSWGVPVPGDPTQTVYVWLDALIGYATASGGHSWPPDLHVVGKDILRFHTLYWPAFLIAAGLDPPRAVHCHSHWTSAGAKMSKSRGNVIRPETAASALTVDGLRYFLLREAVAHDDADYDEVRATKLVNAELADTFGNLVSRCSAPALNARLTSGLGRPEGEAANALVERLRRLPEAVAPLYDKLEVHHGVDGVMAVLRAGNGFFEAERPWELARSGDGEAARRLSQVLRATTETLRVCSTCCSRWYLGWLTGC